MLPQQQLRKQETESQNKGEETKQLCYKELKGNDRKLQKITPHPEITSPLPQHSRNLHHITKRKENEKEEKINKTKDVT